MGFMAVCSYLSNDFINSPKEIDGFIERLNHSSQNHFEKVIADLTVKNILIKIIDFSSNDIKEEKLQLTIQLYSYSPCSFKSPAFIYTSFPCSFKSLTFIRLNGLVVSTLKKVSVIKNLQSISTFDAFMAKNTNIVIQKKE
jgi:hypothetical protein